jgi:hypothetical protein
MSWPSARLRAPTRSGYRARVHPDRVAGPQNTSNPDLRRTTAGHALSCTPSVFGAVYHTERLGLDVLSYLLLSTRD